MGSDLTASDCDKLSGIEGAFTFLDDRLFFKPGLDSRVHLKLGILIPTSGKAEKTFRSVPDTTACAGWPV
jgi:hypothetical protein